MTWITPITDRNGADIANRTARGFLNVSDINRIEGNIAWLINELRRFNIFVSLSTVTDWDVNKLPVVADFVRIRNNIDTLVTRIHAVRPDLRASIQHLPEGRFWQLDFATVNVLELNVYLLRQLIDRMSIIFRQASFKSGQQLFLPQRRA